jgi:hypothetical protein
MLKSEQGAAVLLSIMLIALATGLLIVSRKRRRSQSQREQTEERAERAPRPTNNGRSEGGNNQRPPAANSGQTWQSRIRGIRACIAKGSRFLLESLNNLSGAILAAATVALALIAYWQYGALDKTDHTLKDTLVASNRAWLGPVDAVLDEQLQIGQPIKVSIIFENTGRAPALDVLNSPGEGVAEPISPQEAAQQQKTGPYRGTAKPVCGTPHSGYPAVFPAANRPFEVDAPQAFGADIVIKGAGTFYVYGCAAYRTMDEVHTSQYCFWLGQKIDQTTGRRKFQPCLGSFGAN